LRSLGIKPVFVVVAYDIPDDKRRTRLYKTLMRFGEPVQFSVFECILTEDLFTRMRRAVVEVVDPDEDDVRYYEICESCHRDTVTLGKAITTSIKPVYIV
jgi:CRISPR-associated protein Cas2